MVKYALGAIDPHLPKLYWASQAYTAYESQELQIVFGCSAVFFVLTARFGMGYLAASALGHLFNYVLFPYVFLYFVFLHMLYLVLHIFAFFILNLYIWFLRTLYFKRSRWLLAGASQRLHRH